MGLEIRNARARRRLWRQRLLRALGQQRRADILYVRLLEGWLRPSAIAALYDTARASVGPGAIVEIGSWKGKSTVALALGVRRARRPDRVYAIDPHPSRSGHPNLPGENVSTWPHFLATLREAGVAPGVVPLRMNSVAGARELSARGERVKLLFVDGAHDEASVRRDLEAFLPLLLPGAWVALDDARPEGKFPGVYRAFQAVLGDRTGPPRWASSLLARLGAGAARSPDPSARRPRAGG